MPTIREFIVVEPPTSEAVQELALQQLGAGGLLPLTLKPEQEVPSPTEETVAFRIAQVTTPTGEGMTISGNTEDGASVTVRISADLGAPATASVVAL